VSQVRHFLVVSAIRGAKQEGKLEKAKATEINAENGTKIGPNQPG
jgi:hypothetical protein